MRCGPSPVQTAGGQENSAGNKVACRAVSDKMTLIVSATDPQEQFEQVVLPHLDAAYNLARWLAGNDHDAQDVTQEASLRAFKFFGNFRGDNPRAWLLTIVRNTFYTWLSKNRAGEKTVELNDEALDIEDISLNAEAMQSRFADADAVRRAIAE